MIKALLFDVDGVLLDSYEANWQFYLRLFAKAGYNQPTLLEYAPLMHNTMEGVIRGYTQASDEEVKRVFELALQSIKELYPYNLLKRPPYALHTIQKLHTQYQLGIVTSRVKRHIYSMHPLAPLKKYFQVTVGVEDTTQHKPHPEPLLFAARQLAISPQEAVYIGDAMSDMTAGKTAGMRTILFGNGTDVQADARTSSFSKLPDIIADLK